MLNATQTGSKSWFFSNYFSLFTIIWTFVGAAKKQPQKHSRWNSCSTEKSINTNVTPYATIIKHKAKICACIYFVWLIKYAKQVSFPFSLAIGWAIFGWLFSSLIHTQIKIYTSKRQFFWAMKWNEMRASLVHCFVAHRSISFPIYWNYVVKQHETWAFFVETIS